MAMNIELIDLPAHMPLPGLRVRSFRFPEDIPSMASVFNRDSESSGVGHVVSAADLERQYGNLVNVDLQRDVIVADIDRTMIAYGRVEWRDENDGIRNYFNFVRIVPEWRGKGVEKLFFDYFMRRAQEIDREYPTCNQSVLTTHINEQAFDLAGVLEQLGYRPIRYSFDMKRDLSQPIPALALPAGVEVRPATPDQYRQIWEASTAAFMDHWGAHEPVAGEYEAWLESNFFQPHVWQVAWQGSEVVGIVQNFINQGENEYHKRLRGYTEGISTSRPWRRQGIASALIARSMHMFKELGMTEAALGVDALNPNGALGVYEQLGFTVEQKTIVYRKPLHAE